MLAQCETDFQIDRHLIGYLQSVPYFAELSRQLRKVPTMQIPTAAVSYDIDKDEAIMYYNPLFMKKQSDWQIRGTINHEFYHLTFGHLNARRKRPAKLWNIASDLAINSIIIAGSKDTRPKDSPEDDSPLPHGVLIPGEFPIHPTGRKLTSEEQEASKLGQLIQTFPTMEASEWYFNKLLQKQQEQQKGKGKGKGGEGGQETESESGGDDYLDSFDDHGMWDEVPEEFQEYVEGRIKSMVEKAVKYADGHPSGWGNIPAHIREEIRMSVSTIINWRAVLRQFIGSLVRGKRSSSIKRINKRYPYIHPGTKRGYVAKLLVAMDQSYSVDDGMLNEFFNELGSLTRKVTIDVLPFDSGADVKEVFEWKKGTVPRLVRTRKGGTNFDAPTNVFNDPANRGRWDGLLIQTDGECCAPGPCRGKRGWILGKGHKLLFPSDELQISLDNANAMSGAWR